MTRSSIAVIVVALALTGASRPAWAQYFPQSEGNLQGFAVTGKGTASAKPNRLEIDLEVSASSELTADAIVKYRDAKRRLQDAFVALKLDNVTVEERGLNVDQKGAQMSPYFFDSQPSRKAKTEVQLTRKLIVKCSDIRKLDEEALLQLVAKLLDVAQDAGGKVGATQDPYAAYYYGRYNQSNGLVRFILDDYEKLEEEAYGKAIADAEARAQRLAKLSRLKLGPVAGVRVATSPGDREISPYSYGPSQDDETPQQQKRLESSRFQEIPVKVVLMVRFDSAPMPAENGRVANP
ncbi:SIMPL domain-containing protein [Singulisphaera sp. Ch08]|uniref:SIMPL domain-containing protein n=1 Tax=Singulisphaera sp. Ch08 TaxID=3120278 RepID=A0AAU7CML8_9BACT